MELSQSRCDTIIQAAAAEARAIGVPMNVAVLDSGANLKAFLRMDGALLGSVDIALRKARTAALFGMNTEVIGEFCKPGGTSPGLDATNGGLVVFAGGIPLHGPGGRLISAVGVSGGSVAQDFQVANAAADAAHRMQEARGGQWNIAGSGEPDQPVQALPAAILIMSAAATSAQEVSSQEEANRALIARSFEAWRSGTGGPYDLLAPEVSWTITGNSLAGKTYPSREAFMSEVIRPFNARMRSPLVPTVRRLYAEGDTVVAFFDASGVARDGRPYDNTYAWFLEVKDGQIVRAHAFFDSIVFDDLWRRVRLDQPAE